MNFHFKKKSISIVQLKYLLILFSLLIIISCEEKKEEKVEYNIPDPPYLLNRYYNFSKDEITNSINGIYSTPVNGSVGQAIGLYKDSFYEFRSGSCLYSSYDSGYFKISLDTIFFHTIIKIKDSNRDSHDQLAHLKYANIKDNKIIFNKGRKNEMHTLFKKSIGFDNFDFLDKNGNGESFKLDTFNRTYEKGEYKNFRLIYGWNTTFQNDNDLMGKRKYFKNGYLDSVRN